MGEVLKKIIEQNHEKKYAIQVGLMDVTIDFDEEKAQELDITLPFQSVQEAEKALQEGVFKPTRFLEDDCTEHKVSVLDPNPVTYSGFDGCVGAADRGGFGVINLAG